MFNSVNNFTITKLLPSHMKQNIIDIKLNLSCNLSGYFKMRHDQTN